MIAAIDVDYRSETGPAVVACVVFTAWTDDDAAAEYTITVDDIEPYVPGEFYRRELPCILAVLSRVAETVDTVVVDGHVWLDAGHTHEGLGAHLYAALGATIPVIGVAKNRYHTTPASAELRRGASDTPLYVTAAGVDEARALAAIASMHGAFRIPTLLKRVDSLCRHLA